MANKEEDLVENGTDTYPECYLSHFRAARRVVTLFVIVWID